MRILHIVSYYEPDVFKGGVARAAGLLARGQVRVGGDVTVFTTNSVFGGAQRNPVVENRGGVRVHLFPARRGSRVCFSLSLLQACRERIREYDIVHIHGLWRFPGTVGALASGWAHVPYVLSPHGMLNDWAMRFRSYKKMPYWYAVERRTVGRAAWIHFATDEERYQADFWTAGKESKVIPIGVDLQEFASLPAHGEFRKRQGISSGVPLLVFLGRIHPVKGLEVLLRALIRVKAEVPEVLLAIAGPDEDGYGIHLKRLAQDLGLHDQVRWIGAVHGHSKAALLIDADLFVLPSFSENFGLAAVEAMALGCPVILGSGVNIAPEVENYGAGRVVSTTPDTLAEAVLEVLCDPKLRQIMKEAGKRLVAECYDGETVARKMMKGYEMCLRNP